MTDLKQTVAELERRLSISAAERDELLLQQAASAEILKVINNSRGNLAAVFDAILEKATLLCGAGFSALAIYKGGDMHEVVAHRGAPPALAEMVQAPVRLGPETGLGRLVRGESFVHILDAADDEGYRLRNPVRVALVEIAGARTYLSVPIRKDDVMLGSFTIYRREVRPFSPESIALLQSFATQAAIAMENARLFTETREALERQTATADILKVIASSPSDVQPVFEAIATSANRLIGGFSTAVFRFVDGIAHLAAFTPTNPAADEALKSRFPRPISEYESFELVRGGEPVEIPDTESSRELRDIARARGYRSMLFTPLVSDEAVIGMVSVTRRQTGSFASHHVQLLRTFADQAVIAIENARLFDEVQTKTADLTEALAYQTGSANILRVIASSPTDVAPVLQAIVESACELCEAYDAIVVLEDEGELQMSAHHGPIPHNRTRWPSDRSTTSGRAIADQRPVHVHDVLSEEGLEFPTARALSVLDGCRTLLSIPLLREGESIGAILLRRAEVHPFSGKQIALLQTFADQAVIAIENARLFNETKEALERQTATAEVLQVISNSISEATPVFERILESTERLITFENAAILVTMPDEQVNLAAFRGPEAAAMQGHYPVPLAQSSLPVVMAARRQICFEDVANGPDVPELTRKIARATAKGSFSIAMTPLMWEGNAIGMLNVARDPGVKFNEKELSLLRTFADQAVIAIQNARLFNETQEALERQTATADILKVIASSPSDVQPVFDAIAGRSNRLMDGHSTAVYRFINETAELVSFTRISAEADSALQSAFPRPLSQFPMFELVRNGTTQQIRDIMSVEAEAMFGPTTGTGRDVARARGFRSVLVTPLRGDGDPIGLISVTRKEPSTFAPHHVELLQTFADQAVIAIQNTRLFNDVQARTRELAQSLDDLRAAQDRLVQTEKLASLGQLTAGIAHEIKNPLNFVNNFSALSADLVGELDETLAPAPLDQKMRGDVGELTAMLKANLEKVVQHGKRADSIVKNMLLHSREGSGEYRSADINALLDESLNLAYHGARAERAGFNITLARNLDPDAGAVELYPQEITRALLNLISNGFYAAAKRKSEAGEDSFEPTLIAVTKNLGNKVEIRIRDNGAGIPPEVREKIFNPFFTTKPTGEGTGLGLSMSYDIIVKQHGGRIDVETAPGEFTEFVVTLPRDGRTASDRKPE